MLTPHLFAMTVSYTCLSHLLSVCKFFLSVHMSSITFRTSLSISPMPLYIDTFFSLSSQLAHTKKGFSRPLQVYLLLLLHTCPVLHHTWSQSTPAGHTCQYESCARQCIFSLASVLLQQLSIQFPRSLLSHICHRLTPVSLTLTHLSTQML